RSSGRQDRPILFDHHACIAQIKAVQRMQFSPYDNAGTAATVSDNVRSLRPTNPGPHAGIAEFQRRHNALCGPDDVRHSHPRPGEAPTHDEGKLTFNNGLDEASGVDWCMLRVYTARQELPIDRLMDIEHILVRLTGEPHLFADYAVA